MSISDLVTVSLSCRGFLKGGEGGGGGKRKREGRGVGDM